jgi:hypothetical protein
MYILPLNIYGRHVSRIRTCSVPNPAHIHIPEKHMSLESMVMAIKAPSDPIFTVS